MLILGTFITFIGVVWHQYRNRLRKKTVEEIAREAMEKAAAAELAAGQAVKAVDLLIAQIQTDEAGRKVPEVEGRMV